MTMRHHSQLTVSRTPIKTHELKYGKDWEYLLPKAAKVEW
jgi:hypothetical protein